MEVVNRAFPYSFDSLMHDNRKVVFESRIQSIEDGFVPADHVGYIVQHQVHHVTKVSVSVQAAPATGEETLQLYKEDLNNECHFQYEERRNICFYDVYYL